MEIYQHYFNISVMADGGNFLWAIDGGECQMLLKIGKKDFHVEYVSTFWKEGWWLYQQILVYEEKLYFIPRSADHIAIYDIGRDIWDSIGIEEADIKKNGLPYNTEQKFSFAEIYKKQIYLFPSHYPAIGILNIETGEIRYLYDAFPIKNGESVWKTQGFARKTARNGSRMMIHSPYFGVLYEFDLDTFQNEIIRRIDRDENVKMIAYDGEFFYSIPSIKSAPIRKWDRIGSVNEIITADLSDMEYMETPYYLWTYFGGNIWAFPGLADGVLRIDTSVDTAGREKNEIFRFTRQKGDNLSWKYSCLCNCEDTLFVIDQTDRTLLRVNREEVKKTALRFNRKDYTKMEISKFLSSLSADL